jgi:hypothetical protein
MYTSTCVLATTLSVFSLTFSNLLGLLYLELQIHVLTAILDLACCLVLTVFTAWSSSVVSTSKLLLRVSVPASCFPRRTPQFRQLANLLWILRVREHVVMASTDLAYSFVLAAFPPWRS